MTSKEKHEIVMEAVARAQEVAREKGLFVGGVVAHLSDQKAYDLISVEGNIATVKIPANKTKDGKEVQKKFPLNELFDPNVAKDLVAKILTERLNKGASSDCGTFVVSI